jgi:membrane protease YdiL (CAAX protease family)
LPGEEDRRPGGIETSGESADAFGDRGAHLGADRTGVTRSAPLGNDAQQRSSGVSTPTTITATATPRQQFVGHDITIAGQLTANGAPVADGVVKLYSDGTGLWHSVGDTTTNERGGFAFRVTQPGAGTRSFKVAYAGSPTHEPSVSDELSVTYVTIPTAITATASPRQQFVGRDVTITGTLTADGTPVAEAPITLFNAADAIERVSIANTTTDASGQYKFTLTATAPSHHTYVARSPGDSTSAPVQSAEISVTYVTIPTTITATASPRQQVVGHDVTITGRLLADGTPVAAAPVILYNADDIIERVSIANTTTDASGYYQFTLSDTAPSHHSYVVRPPGSHMLEPSVSDELSVTYVTIPTAITATASPRQQFVGRDVTITGQLTASGVALAEVPVVLYNTDDPKKRVLAATTTTDASGYYQFTRTDSAATTHTYTICAEGDSTYSRAQSTEILVTYATRVEKPLAARVQTVFNLAWYELLSIFLILAGEGLVFAGYRVAGVGVQALNLVAIVGAIGVLKGERVELLEALALVSLLRVVNLSFAVIPTTTLSWLVAIYGVMFIPIIAVVVRRKLSRNDLGLTGGPQLTYLVPTGIIIGVGLALIEYQILANPALIPSYSLVGLVELSVVMIFVVTLVEQLIFRALLQPELIKRSGPMVGILITSIIFGAMQSGFANYYELLFAFGAGLVFGVAFYKTKNLPFVITMQAVNNIFLFGVLPFVPMLAVLR